MKSSWLIVFLTVLLCNTICQAQNFTAGAGIAGSNQLKQLGVNAHFGIEFRDQTFFRVELERLFKQSLTSQVYYKTWSSWGMNMLCVFHFMEATKVSPYVIGGIGFTSLHREYQILMTMDTVAYNVIYPGMVFGGGAEFMVGKLNPYSELKFETATTQGIILLGGRFHF